MLEVGNFSVLEVGLEGLLLIEGCAYVGMLKVVMILELEVFFFGYGIC